MKFLLFYGMDWTDAHQHIVAPVALAALLVGLALVSGCGDAHADMQSGQPVGPETPFRIDAVAMRDGATCYVAHDNNRSHSVAMSCLPKVAP